jgi:hypothetical protein
MEVFMKAILRMTSMMEKVLLVLINSLGVAYFSDGIKYDGEWKDDKYHGKGLLIFPDGRKYEGEFSEGKFFGKGFLFY